MSSNKRNAAPQDMTTLFSRELKRLAAQVEKSARDGNGMVMLSSLAAIGPIVESLVETALATVASSSESGATEESPAKDIRIDPGYL